LKLLFVFVLVVLLLVLIYRRLRPYLKLFKNILRAVRKFSVDGIAPDDNKFSRGDRKRENLIRCSSCGTWVPAARALTQPDSEAMFCSEDCSQRRSASTQRESRRGP